MIYNNLKNLKSIKGIEADVLEALTYAVNNDLASYENGVTEINGKELFLNKVSYKTKQDEDGFWEGHKKYIDIHLMLKGQEKINYNLAQNLKEVSFEEENDFVAFDGEKQQSIILKEDDFAIFYPEDIHMTALTVGLEEEISKVIFKVRL